MLFSPLFAAFLHHNGNVLFQLVGVKCTVLSETTVNTCPCGGVNANLVRGVSALSDVTKSKGKLQKSRRAAFIISPPLHCRFYETTEVASEFSPACFSSVIFLEKKTAALLHKSLFSPPDTHTHTSNVA